MDKWAWIQRRTLELRPKGSHYMQEHWRNARDEYNRVIASCGRCGHPRVAHAAETGKCLFGPGLWLKRKQLD